jgi:hypothetical protein
MHLCGKDYTVFSIHKWDLRTADSQSCLIVLRIKDIQAFDMAMTIKTRFKCDSWEPTWRLAFPDKQHPLAEAYRSLRAIPTAIHGTKKVSTRPLQ